MDCSGNPVSDSTRIVSDAWIPLPISGRSFFVAVGAVHDNEMPNTKQKGFYGKEVHCT